MQRSRSSQRTRDGTDADDSGPAGDATARRRVRNCDLPGSVVLAQYKSLSELVDAGPPLLHLAGGDEHDPEGFFAAWLSSIREVSERH